MHSFKDAAGRDWLVVINVQTIKRVRALTGENLLDIANLADMKPGANLIDRLDDPVLLVDLLYAVCQPDAEAKGVSDIEFGEAMAGDVIEEALQAFLDELVDFFPSVKRRVLRLMLTQTRLLMEKASRQTIAAIESQEFRNELSQELQNLLK